MKKIILVLLILIIGCVAEQQDNASKEEKFSKFNIEPKHQICSINEHCTAMITDCIDCNYQALNKKYLQMYQTIKIKICEEYTGKECVSFLVPETKCINRVCTIVEEE